MPDGRRNNGKEEQTRLSEREKDVARLVCSGLRNKQIARELGISDATVKLHLHHIYQKLGVGGRRQLRALLENACL